MIRKYPNLCKPIQIGRVTFRNRMFSAPMGGTDITNDGCIGPKSTAFYEFPGIRNLYCRRHPPSRCHPEH